MNEKQLDKEIARNWSELGHGVIISMMDIPKIFREAKEAWRKGISIRESIQESILKYGVN